MVIKSRISRVTPMRYYSFKNKREKTNKAMVRIITKNTVWILDIKSKDSEMGQYC